MRTPEYLFWDCLADSLVCPVCTQPRHSWLMEDPARLGGLGAGIEHPEHVTHSLDELRKCLAEWLRGYLNISVPVDDPLLVRLVCSCKLVYGETVEDLQRLFHQNKERPD